MMQRGNTNRGCWCDVETVERLLRIQEVAVYEQVALSRRPGKCSASKQVNVDVVHRLPPISSAIDHRAVAVLESEICGDLSHNNKQVSHQLDVSVFEFA